MNFGRLHLTRMWLWPLCAVLTTTLSAAVARPPNFIVILADDLGYGDLGCYGSTRIKTPRLDRMAAEGMRFTNFYAQTVCGPSRAALMTGCYPLRVATQKNRVETMPRLHVDEITIADVLHDVGYASIAIGKWDLAGHTQLGYTPELLPTHQGFDTFFGTASSNDFNVHLLRDEKMIERAADLSTLTRRYTDEAIDFIAKYKDRPFFVYLAHSMPHTRLAASEQFKGRSAGGLFGDVVEELDWHVGRLLDFVKSAGLDESTWVIFTSDNGPWFFDRHLLPGGDRPAAGGDLTKYPFNQRDERGSHGGSAGALRGVKTSVWEGGLRVPCIVRAPGRVPTGRTSHEIASTLDLLPTCAQLAGGAIPKDRVIDGHDITPLLRGVPGAKSPTRAFFYYQRTRLGAVREGRWKLHLPRPEDDMWTIFSAPADSVEIKRPLLFDLESDVGEKIDLAAQHPAIVARLLALAERARADIGDHDRVGAGARFFDPEPRRLAGSASQAPSPTNQ